MTMPPQQPNPYGQQPNHNGQQPSPYGQGPNPYGQQPGPYGQQANPYGQQPGPYGPQPHPPQPHPQQQYGQPYPQQPHPGAWGGPPMGPPPRKNRTGLTLSIVAASMVFVSALAYFGNRGSDRAESAASTEPFPAATHRLTVPKTLLDQRYKLINDGSADADAEAKEGGYGDGPDSRNTKASIGSYNGSSTDAPDGLILTGVHGQFKDPAQVRDGLLKGLRGSEGMSEPNAPKTITPPGSDVGMTCTVLLSKDEDGTSTVPVCAWGDENTAAYVAFLTPAQSSKDPDSIDLEETAATTLKVREEARQPIA
ncbi:hypothetical protein [Streptomyces sp. NPDC055749]